jgi:tRNA uridine 5-carboxymethylaminomethyl modification enzyme
LTESGIAVGLVDEARRQRFEARREAIESLRNELRSTRIEGITLEQILRRPPTTWDELVDLVPRLATITDDESAIEQVTIEAKYGGYISRQADQVERFRRLEDKPIPVNLDYQSIPQLRAEAREKFETVRPRSLGQAGRISGINPADVATLLIHLKRSGPSAPVEEEVG